MNKIDKKQEGKSMNVEIDAKRSCSVSESIIEAFREVKEMREGKMPKHSLDELFSNIEEWRKE